MPLLHENRERHTVSRVRYSRRYICCSDLMAVYMDVVRNLRMYGSIERGKSTHKALKDRSNSNKLLGVTRKY